MCVKVSKILPNETNNISQAAPPYRSRRLRGLSPLCVSPLVGRTRRRGNRATSAPAPGAAAPPTSPVNSGSSYLNSRRESVIVHSNPDSGNSTPKSGEWDHYTEQPSFWHSRFGWLHQPSQIQLVDTESDSSLEFDQNLFGGIKKLLEDGDSESSGIVVPSTVSLSVPSISVTSSISMSVEENKIRISNLKRIHNAIKAELALFTPDDLTEAAVSLLPGHLDSIKQLYVQLSSAVDDFEDDFPDESSLIEQWKTKLNNARNEISNNRKLLMEKK